MTEFSLMSKIKDRDRSNRPTGCYACYNDDWSVVQYTTALMRILLLPLITSGIIHAEIQEELKFVLPEAERHWYGEEDQVGL